ncbi:MAG: polyprenyl synthetase family protein [Clostridia bacterium]|nr:polyprenyl synthetase family protein [Clostridia bacterium]
MIDNFLNNYKKIVEDEIDRLFPDIDTSWYKEVLDASRYSLRLGGKRIRPIIMLEFCKLFGGDIKDALSFAVALEMIHTYSLIHDDLPCMDNDDMRRGKPACHIKFGEDIALLAGDTLLTESFKIAADAQIDADKKVKAIAVLAERAGLHGMIGGQVMDLSFEKRKPTLEELRAMYIKKTGCLISAAAEIGSIIGGANTEQLETAKAYALNLGLAFQIIDDILDVIGDEAVLGKPIGSDEDNQKTTFVTILGLDKAREMAKDLTTEALGILKTLSLDTVNLEELTRYLLDRNY